MLGSAVRTNRIGVLSAVHTDATRSDGVLAVIDEETGFARLRARIARVGVQTYSDGKRQWGEYRDESEVFSRKSMASFSLLPVTDDHPSDIVTADNIQDLQRGTVGNIHRDGDYLSADVLITDSATVQKIRDGKTQLSCGYSSEVHDSKGTTNDGVPYTKEQTKIRGNHVALVDAGRAGAAVCVRDSSAYAIERDSEMSKKKKLRKKDKKKTLRKKDEFPPKGEKETEDVEEEETEDVEEEETKDVEEELEDEEEEEEEIEDEEEEEETEDSITSLRAQIASLKSTARTDAANESRRIDARVKLVASAASIGVKSDGRSDAAVMRSIVLKVDSSLKRDLDDNKSDAGYLRASYKFALDRHARGARHVADTDTLTHVREDVVDSYIEDAMSAYFNRGTGKGTK